MTWIRTVPLAEAGESLLKALQAQQALYPREYAEPVPAAERREAKGEEMAGIVGSHSLIPEALYHAFATFGALMSPDLPLTRRQHELITTVVSVTNRCRY
jgi:alkylhydroperoxidase family enzyme